MCLPNDHRRSISGANRTERPNAEIDWGAEVVRIVPTLVSLLRLAIAVAGDQRDEWEDDRRLVSRRSVAWLNPDGLPGRANPLTEVAPPD